MTIFQTFVVFMLTWWLVFYLTLPFGNKQEDNLVPGQVVSAPKNPRIKLKMAIATGITAIITLIFYIYMNY